MIYHRRFKAYLHNKDYKRKFIARWEFSGGIEIDTATTIDWLRKRGREVQSI